MTKHPYVFLKAQVGNHVWGLPESSERKRETSFSQTGKPGPIKTDTRGQEYQTEL